MNWQWHVYLFVGYQVGESNTNPNPVEMDDDSGSDNNIEETMEMSQSQRPNPALKGKKKEANFWSLGLLYNPDSKTKWGIEVQMQKILAYLLCRD